jgi:hypothetical protein
MALGKIKADTLEHSTAGTVDTQYVVKGSAKSWINFNATGTIATRDSFNVSGIVDEKTGITTVSFTNNMQTNANYATMMGGHDIADSEDFNSQHIFVNRFTSSNYIVQNCNSASAAADWELNNAANFGDLA